jgi:small subunit ribosomal protein S9
MENKFIWGTGRRKTAVARVRLCDGSGKITINGRAVDEYFTEAKHRSDVMAPLHASGHVNKVDLLIKVDGGGFAGQAGAVVLGIARALKQYSPDHFATLRQGGYLTRDPRMKERKKYGQKAARKRFQFSKR